MKLQTILFSLCTHHDLSQHLHINAELKYVIAEIGINLSLEINFN